MIGVLCRHTLEVAVNHFQPGDLVHYTEDPGGVIWFEARLTHRANAAVHTIGMGYHPPEIWYAEITDPGTYFAAHTNEFPDDGIVRVDAAKLTPLIGPGRARIGLRPVIVGFLFFLGLAIFGVVRFDLRSLFLGLLVLILTGWYLNRRRR
jgi:hypothetical protein